MVQGRYVVRVLAAADDYQEANDADVLSFWQAQEHARQLAARAKVDAGIVKKPRTVRDAAENYMDWFREHRRSVPGTQHAIDLHILPTLGEKYLHELTTAELMTWLENLAVRPRKVRAGRKVGHTRYYAAAATADEKRARRATANRILNILKAILNRAFERGLVSNDIAWRRLKAFRNVDEGRVRFLNVREIGLLLWACPSDLRLLVSGALLTGARYGELVRLTVDDLDLHTRRLHIAQAKSRARFVPLNDEAVELFTRLAAGKPKTTRIFVKANGSPWGVGHHGRFFRQACEAAGLEGLAFHELRHTFASQLAQARIDLLTISKLLGHADTRMTSKHYAHLADRTLSEAVAKLPNLGISYEPRLVTQLENAA